MQITKNDLIKMQKHEVWIKRPWFLPFLRFSDLVLINKERFYNRQQLIEKGFKIGDLPELVQKYDGVDLPLFN